MSNLIEVTVPDLGDFADVDVIEVLVSSGDQVAEGDSLLSLETDKASMEVPAPTAGVIRDVKVEAGGLVNQGDVVFTMEAQEAAAPSPQPKEAPAPKAAPQAAPAPVTADKPSEFDCELLVLGSGPGGYTAAFRGADLGKKTILIERYPSLGGVCLNVGCIPSKALLHAAKVIEEAAEMAEHGISFGKPKINLKKLHAFKTGVISQLTGGIGGLAKARGVEAVHGYGRFTGPHTIEVEGEDGKRTISFENCIIAAGSRVFKIPGIPYDDPRVMDSTDALELPDIPKRLLVVGGGIIGLELATVYEALGSKVTIVELMDRIVAGADKDIVRPLHKRIEKRYENIYLKTKVTEIKAEKKGLRAYFEGDKAPSEDLFDRVLVAVGRRPNGDLLDIEKTGVHMERGFIPVDKQQRTNVPHIFAIGDIVGQPMLAHKATHEAKVAAEVIAGMKSYFDARVIPSVAYTDPEVAWVGMTEEQAKKEGVKYGKGVFPWAASGRSLAIGRKEGMTKLIFDEETHQVIGAAAVGTNAGEIIAEAGLAIEMGCDAADIGLTVHAHPTLSESVAMAAEAFEGTITDLYIPKKK